MPDERDAEVARAIARVEAGEAPDAVESETLDCKEDPSRRAPRGHRLPGRVRDDAAAYLLAETCGCLANHEGGAVIVGLEDRAHGAAAFAGTDLDAAWLRRRLRELISPPPAVSVRQRQVGETRLLVLLVPRNPGAEPHVVTVSKGGRHRRPRRVDTGCHDMTTLTEQISWLEERRGQDWSAAPSGRSVDDVRAAALEAMRDYLSDSVREDRQRLARLADQELLRHLQVLRDDGRTLTRGGARLLCAAPEAGFVYLGRPGASARAELRSDGPGRGLIEELRDVERIISGRNRSVPLPTVGLAEGTAPALAPRAIREALVNAIMHRDHDIPEPIVIEHTGDELVVFSPGDLFGGVTIDRLLSAPPRTRNRLLGETLRSLGLAEREGTGIDRMYIEQIRLGHPAPVFRAHSGGVRVVLAGGDPQPEVLRAHAALPEALRQDARAAIAIDRLRRAPSITRADLATAAQADILELEAFIDLAERAGLLQRTARPRPGGESAWRLSDRIRDALGPILPYRGRPIDESISLVADLARAQGGVRNQDVQDLLSLSGVRASGVLKEAERRGIIELGPGSAARGRSVWYRSVDTGDSKDSSS